MESNGVNTAANKPSIHGRACASCARAKAKCVAGIHGDGKCERCNRLQKPCEAMPLRPKAQPRKRRPLDPTGTKENRVAKLEEKLDDLVSLLKSRQENSNAQIVPPLIPQVNLATNPSSEPLRSPPLPLTDESTLNQADTWDDRLHLPGPIHRRFGLPPYSTIMSGPFSHFEDPLKRLGIEIHPPYQLASIDLGIEDPDVLLTIFRREMNPNFPFIHIDDSVSASHLRRTSPTLFTAVMAVTTRNTHQHFKIGKQLTQQIADRIIIRGERSLEILLGILVFAGWNYTHFLNIHQLTSLITSATALVADLRLNMESSEVMPGPFDPAVLSTYRKEVRVPLGEAKARTMEERRAFLGYWLITSIVAGFFRRLDTPIWTDYHESSCRILESSSSDPNDKIAAQLVRIQLLADKILQSPWHSRQELHGSPVPPTLYFNSMQKQLNGIKESCTEDVKLNNTVLLSWENIEILLYKIGLSKCPSLSSLSFRDFNRLEALYACQRGVVRFFNIFLGTPTSQYHCWSVPVFSMLAWNLGILQLLCQFDHPDWNLDWARETLSFIKVLGQLQERYSNVKHVLGIDPHTRDGEDLFSSTAKKLTWIRTFFEGRLCKADGNAESCAPDIPNFDLPQDAEFIDFIDDQWMRDLLGPWDQ